MQYPVWFLPHLNGGLLIALMSVFHVFLAHFAVGGGLFLVLAERKGLREDSRPILDYVKRHTKFFLLLTMVLGGLTGVGIWFTIALVSPGPTSTLIHSFVFGWATEWVFFIGEITALLIYFYYFDKLRPRDHQIVGWLYFAFAWLSLFIINGIVGFMLTPGAWLETGNFWDGFFNPSFWPALFFRSFLAFTFAGLFAFVTAPWIPEPEAREAMVRWSGKWVAAPFLLLLASGWWYLQAMPPEQSAMILQKSVQTPPFLQAFIPVSVAVLLAGSAAAWFAPNRIRKPMACLLLILGLTQMGVFEWLRETARRPYVIFQHTWSNSIKTADAASLNQNGMLSMSPWGGMAAITPENRLAAGEYLFSVECHNCHGLGGPKLDIVPRTAKFTVFGMDAQLNGQGTLREYMPPFVGTRSERAALASFLVEGVHGKKEAAPLYTPPQLPTEIPPFDQDTAEYVLLSWNNLGMHCISDSDPYWILLPPANDLFAQLIRRGPKPQVVTAGVTLTYHVEPGFENPSKHVRFWEFAESLFGKKLPENVGVSGNGVSGAMGLDKELKAFSAGLVPVVPYPDDGSFNPYPLFTIEARDTKTGKLLASTRNVAPTSTEMGCRNCHGGEWRVQGVAGFTDATSSDVLAVHDRISGTDLLARAKAGKPMLCQSCHADPVLGTKGDPDLLVFPAAIHGWHANYLTGRGAEVCTACHPNNPAGPTRCLRGVHAERGIDCTQCHGALEDHALSLLKKEQEAGKKGAERLMRHLKPRAVASVADIKSRTPWLMEPDCASCHDFKAKPKRTASAYNKWTDGKPGSLYRLRHEQTGTMLCESCHGSTHAEYPASNLYGKNRDNIPPMQYQGVALSIGAQGNCKVCHEQAMEGFVHHPLVK